MTAKIIIEFKEITKQQIQPVFEEIKKEIKEQYVQKGIDEKKIEIHLEEDSFQRMSVWIFQVNQSITIARTAGERYKLRELLCVDAKLGYLLIPRE